MLLNNKWRLLLGCLFVITGCFSLFACGKKGDPTLKSYDKPEPPSQLTAIHRESEIILSWNFPKSKEPSIKGFHLLKSTGGDFEEVTLLTNDRRSYIDTRFEINAEYRYKVVAQNLKGILSKDSNILVIKPAGACPSEKPFLHCEIRFTHADMGRRRRGHDIQRL